MPVQTMLLAVVLAIVLMVDVILYQIYWGRYAAEYGFVNYSAGTGFYIFWKLEIF